MCRCGGVENKASYVLDKPVFDWAMLHVPILDPRSPDNRDGFYIPYYPSLPPNNTNTAAWNPPFSLMFNHENYFSTIDSRINRKSQAQKR